MNLQEFETQYRHDMEKINQLQTAVLLLAQLETEIAKAEKDLQNLSQKVEEFITQQSAEEIEAIRI